jgi:hypothetical protein
MSHVRIFRMHAIDLDESCYVLLFVHGGLFIVICALLLLPCYLYSAICALLFVECYLCIVICVLLFVPYYLYSVISSLLFVYCYLCLVICAVLFVHCGLFIVICALLFVPYNVCIVICALLFRRTFPERTPCNIVPVCVYRLKWWYMIDNNRNGIKPRVDTCENK